MSTHAEKTATKRNFLGIPVEGESPNLSRGASVPQKPLSELEPIFRAVLETPDLVGFRWRQYTPYFADGDPCEFGIYDVEFKFKDTEEDAGDFEDGFDYFDSRGSGHWESRMIPNPRYQQMNWFYPTGTGQRSYQAVDDRKEVESQVWVADAEQREGFDALAAVAKAIPGGAFYDVLYDNFGDHAEITVYKDRIEVESYEHE